MTKIIIPKSRFKKTSILMNIIFKLIIHSFYAFLVWKKFTTDLAKKGENNVPVFLT